MYVGLVGIRQNFLISNLVVDSVTTWLEKTKTVFHRR